MSQAQTICSIFDGDDAVARLADDAAREAGISDVRSDRDKASETGQSIEEVKI